MKKVDGDNGVYETEVDVPNTIQPVELERILESLAIDNTPFIIIIEDNEDGTQTVFIIPQRD